MRFSKFLEKNKVFRTLPYTLVKLMAMIAQAFPPWLDVIDEEALLLSIFYRLNHACSVSPHGSASGLNFG